MCGFLVAVGASGVRLRNDAFEAGFKRIAHRGPDGATHREQSLSWGHVSMSVCRLEITGGHDVAEASRMMTACGEMVVAFNGEIYNHRELRDGPLSEYTWRTECDTEVLLHAWHRWRKNCVDHLNGMFAFVIVDPVRNLVFAARDRAGEKPLYVAEHNGVTYLASEIKALPIDLRETGCRDLDALEFDFDHATPFHGVTTLQPGHTMCIDASTDLRPEYSPYWELPHQSSYDDHSPKTTGRLLDDITDVLVDAIRIRARTERPLAALVSGGLDSAIIQAVTGAEHRYTVAFEDEQDTIMPTAYAAANGYLHNGRTLQRIGFTLTSARTWLPDIAYHLDTPATWTAIAQWFLAKQIRANHGRGTVVLTGEGADETFGGYSRYKVLKYIDAMRDDPALVDYLPLEHHLFGSDMDILTRLLDRSDGKLADHVGEVVGRSVRFKDHRAQPSLVRAAMRLDWHTTMQCLLRMLDRMMMAHALEARCPFLDHRVVELAAQLPDDMLVGPAGTKLALREIARRLGVHRSITDETRKRGFYVPWNTWTSAARGSRGAWDRSDFAKTMRQAWRDHGPAGRHPANP